MSNQVPKVAVYVLQGATKYFINFCIEIDIKEVIDSFLERGFKIVNIFFNLEPLDAKKIFYVKVHEYGLENVRNGKYRNPILSDDEKEEIYQEMRERSGACSVCLDFGCKRVPKPSHPALPLPISYPPGMKMRKSIPQQQSIPQQPWTNMDILQLKMYRNLGLSMLELEESLNRTSKEIYTILMHYPDSDYVNND